MGNQTMGNTNNNDNGDYITWNIMKSFYPLVRIVCGIGKILFILVGIGGVCGGLCPGPRSQIIGFICLAIAFGLWITKLKYIEKTSEIATRNGWTIFWN